MESSYVVTFYFRDLGEFLFSLCVKSSESIPSRMEFFYVFLGFGIVGFSAQADKSCLTDSKKCSTSDFVQYPFWCQSNISDVVRLEHVVFFFDAQVGKSSFRLLQFFRGLFSHTFCWRTIWSGRDHPNSWAHSNQHQRELIRNALLGSKMFPQSAFDSETWLFVSCINEDEEKICHFRTSTGYLCMC